MVIAEIGPRAASGDERFFRQFALLEQLTHEGDGNGNLYRAQAQNQDCPVALRLLPIAGNAWGIMRPQLMAALATASQVAHGGVTRVHEYGTHDGCDFIVRDWVPGEPLARILAAQRRNAEQHGLIWLRQVAESLDSLHRSGLAHGALTPNRIIVDASGHTHITDFGYASLLPAKIAFQDYAAPECVDTIAATPASDQFSLAAIAFEMLSGRPLPPSDSSGLYRFAVRTAFAENFSASVGVVMSRALAIDPVSRYSTCTAFIDALMPACGVVLPKPAPEKPVAPAAPVAMADVESPRHMGWATAIGLMVAFAAVAGVLYMTSVL